MNLMVQLCILLSDLNKAEEQNTALLQKFPEDETARLAQAKIAERRDQPANAIELLEGFVPSGRPVLVLATKADKLNTTAQRASVVNIRKQLEAQFPLGAGNVTVQLFSATARLGIEEAEAVIAGWL